MKRWYILSSIGTFLIGILVWAYLHNIIIINNPRSINTGEKKESVYKKTVTLWLWNQDRWKQEKVTILWSEDIAATLLHIINRWLIMAYEEHVIKKKIVLETACLSACQQKAYISFNRNLFSKHASIFEKAMLIESLLKTVRENEITIQIIQFFVGHRALTDSHLDFNRAWHIRGYVTS